MLDWINNNAWAVSIVTLLLGAYINSLLTKNKDLLIKVADKKSQYYADFISAYLENQKTDYERKRENDNGEISDNYLYRKNMVLLYGSNEVIKQLMELERDSEINFRIRKNMGNYVKLIDLMKQDIQRPKLLNTRWRRKKKEHTRLNELNAVLFGDQH